MKVSGMWWWCSASSLQRTIGCYRKYLANDSSPSVVFFGSVEPIAEHHQSCRFRLKAVQRHARMRGLSWAKYTMAHMR